MSEPGPGYPTDDDVDAVLDQFDGDATEAIRALLSNLVALAADHGACVSKGYVRGNLARSSSILGRNGAETVCTTAPGARSASP